MDKHAKVIEALQFAKEQIEEILSDAEDVNHKIRLTHRLQMDIDHVNLLFDIGIQSETPTILPPATTIGGKKIVYKQKVSEKDVDPDEDKVKVLRKQVKEAYDAFLTTENSELLKLDGLVIRGVAKKAGLNKVNKDNPETITAQFIDEIKAAIKSKE